MAEELELEGGAAEYALELQRLQKAKQVGARRCVARARERALAAMLPSCAHVQCTLTGARPFPTP